MQYRVAEQYAKKAIDAYLACESESERLCCDAAYINLAEAYAGLQDRDSALKALQESDRFHDQQAGPVHLNSLRRVLNHSVNVYILLHDFHTALSLLLDLKEQFENHHYTKSPYYQVILDRIEFCEKHL